MSTEWDSDGADEFGPGESRRVEGGGEREGEVGTLWENFFRTWTG